MSWTSRLLLAVVLALHAAAPLAAYARPPALPDFGALCSVVAPAPGAPAHTPQPQSHGDHTQHCAVCGAALGAALPPADPVRFVPLAPRAERFATRHERAVMAASPLPRARGPPAIG